ncbi:MAG: leucine-rich repeat protein [Clostridia bacterium]|nr:leucine-rich repeat protein [Clostridia bacterium]
MPLGTILTKGEIELGLTDFPVVPKQFILMSGEGNAKRLLVRFENRREERLSSLTLAIRQYDIRGALLRKDTYEIPTRQKAGEFAPERDFPILPACEDFKLEVVSASFGSYKYLNKDGKSQIVYENRAERALADRTPAFSSMHERRHYARARTLRSPFFFIPMIVLFAIVVSMFVAIRINLFINENETFTLDGMKYMLTSKDEDCTTVSFVGYLGEKTDITVPENIEGYKVVSVSKHALKGSGVTSLTVEGDSVILPYAFSECALKTVSLPFVKEIGEGAFKGAEALSGVSLSGELTSIGKDAFAGCKSLSELNLPASLKSLGDGALSGCSTLTALTVPDGIESIGNEILNGASSLKSLTLPFIGRSASESTTLRALIGAPETRGSLSALTVSAQSVIGKDVFSGESGLTTVKYINPITEIGENAFLGCAKLESFSVPKECTSVGASAFSGCTSLSSLDYKAASAHIPEKMLFGCASLEKFDIPTGVTSLGKEAFFGCKALTALTVGEGVTAIGEGVIGDCTSLERLSVYKLPEGVTPLTMCGGTPSSSLKLVSISGGDVIVKDAFRGFSALKSVYLPIELSEIGESAFSGCTSLEIMSIPAGVGSIGKYAFSGCASLPSVVIPSGVGTIPEGAFLGCSSLGSAELPRELGEIGDLAFSGCTSLAGITLGDSLTALGKSAFSGCTSLAYASLGSSVEYVSENAFSGCSSLGSVSLPSNIKTIHDGAYSGCSSLTVLVIPKTLESIGEGAFEGCSSVRELSVAFLGAGRDSEQTRISYLFAGKTPASLKKLTVDGVSEIPTGSLEGLSSVEEIILTTCTMNEIEPFSFRDLKSLRRVLLPISVETLGESAFMGCSALVSINFPDSLRVIGDRAFRLCTALPQISLNTGLYSIGIGAFSDCRELTSVSIPQGVEIIGEGSFLGCGKLTAYTAPFTGIGRTSPKLMPVFGTEPVALKQIVITAGDAIGDEAFLGFSRVTDITVPASVKRIGASAFSGCSALTRLNIPTVLKSIGEGAFSGCASIRSLSLPKELDQIGERAFSGCTSLEAITLPFVGLTKQEPSLFYFLFGDAPYHVPKSLKTVTVNAPVSLTSSAFRNSLYIEEIAFEGGVSEIGAYAIANCNSLKRVTLSGNLTSIKNNAFTDTERLRTVINKTGGDITSMLEAADAMNYVLKIATDISEISTTVKDGFTMLLADDGEWYCTDFDISVTGTSLVLPDSFEFGGATVDSYKLARRLVFVNDNISSDIKSVHISSAVNEICEWAFAKSDIVTLTADASSVLASIGESAFLDCDKLTVATLPETLGAIENDAFLGCESLILVYNLSDLGIVAGQDSFGYVAKYAESVIESSPLPMTTVTVGDFVLEGAYDTFFLKEYIGNSTVADIRNLTYSGNTINNIIILKDAFRGSNVRRVILGECVSRIHEGAFLGANSIYEVVALCTRVTPSLSAPDECGGVCRNAVKLFTSADEELVYYTEENATGEFLFAAYGSEVYLVEAELKSDVIILPELVNGNACDYSVFKTALDEEELDGAKLVLPATVVNVHGDITAVCDNTTLMYLGTKSGLDIILNTDDFLRVYYYAECVHDDMTFTLDGDGMPTTEYTETTVTVTKEPTCTENGKKTESCDICHSEWTEDIISEGHKLSGGVCTVCGIREDVTVEGDDLTAYDIISASGSSPFTLTAGVLSATAGAGKNAILTVSAVADCTVSFDFALEGDGAFTFVIRKGTSELQRCTADTADDFNIALGRGEALILMLSASSGAEATLDISTLHIAYS